MQLDAARNFGAGSTVPCVDVTSRGSIPGSEVVTIHQLDPVATITAFKHLHSTNTAPQDTSFPPVLINTPDPTTHTCSAPCNLPTDVEIGSVVSLGFGINGERDIVDYNTHVAPKVFIPNHVTAVAVESSSLEWKVGYRKQQDAMGIPAADRPDLRWLVDPNDYLRPLVFDPKDPRWDKSHRHDH